MNTKMRKRTRAEAKKLMWEYYRDNKEFLPKSVRALREELIEELVLGTQVTKAFQMIVQNEL